MGDEINIGFEEFFFLELVGLDDDCFLVLYIFLFVYDVERTVVKNGTIFKHVVLFLDRLFLNSDLDVEILTVCYVLWFGFQEELVVEETVLGVDQLESFEVEMGLCGFFFLHLPGSGYSEDCTD